MPLRPRRALAVIATLALGATLLGLGAAPALAAPPVNDHLPGAIPLAYTTVNGMSFAEATSEPGEPVPPPVTAPSTTGRVWFSFTADKSRTVRLETSSGDTVLGALHGSGERGDLRGLRQVGCNDDVALGGPFTSRVVTQVTAGTTYYVQLGTYSTSAADHRPR